MYDVEMTRNSREMCMDNAAMIAWMGWEIINVGL
jgi:tRNA A37 threonylcarbamoyltransferase TsaD